MMRVVIAAIAYLIGSIPSGYLLGRGIRHEDIRQVGSGNSGTTNAFRTMGKVIGLLTLLCDFGKGAIACLLAGALVPGDDYTIALASGMAVLGHCYSCFLSFNAGKGVATAAGVLSIIEPYAVLLLLPVFGLIFLLRGIVSLASLSVAALMPFTLLLLHVELPEVIAGFLITVLVIFRHRANIRRLIDGTEVSFKK